MKRGPKPGYNKQLEDRLNALEQLVKSLNLRPEQLETLNAFKQNSPSPSSNGSRMPFRQELLDLFRTTALNGIFLFGTVESVLAMASQCDLLMNALLAKASLFAPPELVLSPFATAAEMAQSYYEEAEALVQTAFVQPTEAHVLGFVVMAWLALSLQRQKAAMQYHSIAFRTAIDLGLNNEETLTSTGSDYDHEVRRGVWWTCFHVDRIAAASLIRSTVFIRDEDCLVRLPNTTIANAIGCSFDELVSIQKAIVSSQTDFVPSLPGQSLQAYMVLLIKISGNLVAYRDDFFRNEAVTQKQLPLFAEHRRRVKQQELAIMASLHEWNRCIPEKVRNLTLVDENRLATDPQTVWMEVLMQIAYDSIYVALLRVELVKLVSSGEPRWLESSIACKTIALISHGASLVQQINALNPKYLNIHPIIHSHIFSLALSLVLFLKADLNPIDRITVEQNMNVLMCGLEPHVALWKPAETRYHILHRLLECDTSLLVTKALFHLRGLISSKNTLDFKDSTTATITETNYRQQSSVSSQITLKTTIPSTHQQLSSSSISTPPITNPGLIPSMQIDSSFDSSINSFSGFLPNDWVSTFGYDSYERLLFDDSSLFL